MKCPNLLRSMILSCNADERPYVPSLFELEEYCNRKEHQKCPLYRDLCEVGATNYEAWKSPAP